MLEWTLAHDFWSTVILSPEKFRKHFTQMSAQRDRDGRVPNPVAEAVQRSEAVRESSISFEREVMERNKISTPMPKGFKDILRKGIA